MAVAGDLAKSEPGDDQRRVGLDVGAHHEDVSGLERFVVLEKAQEDVPQHVDLAVRAVAAVDLDAAVIWDVGASCPAYLVGADVVLEPAEQRVGFGCATEVFVSLRLREAALEFTQVAAEGGEQWVVDVAVAGVFAS